METPDYEITFIAETKTDKCASLRVTKRSGHHQNRPDNASTTSWCGERLCEIFRCMNSKLLNLEASLQSLQQGFFITAALGVPFYKV